MDRGITRQMVAAFLLLFLPRLVYAQYSLEAGLSVPLYLKGQFEPGAKYSPTGNAGLNAILRISGTSPNSLSYLQSAGIFLDKTAYVIAPGNSIFVYNYFVSIAPSVEIPSKWERISYKIGVGVLWNISSDVGWKMTNVQNNSFVVNVDTIFEKLDQNKERIIPFASVGVFYKISKSITAGLSISQTFMKYYDPNTTIDYSASGNLKQIVLNYQPTYFGIDLEYFFHRK